MADIFVDAAGSNTSPYDTWAKAANTLQTAITYASSLDVIYCRGSETLTTTPIDINTKNSITIIGCNASGVEDGTFYVIDGDGSGTGTANPCIDFNNGDYIELRNIKIIDGAGYGIDSPSAGNDFCRFFNVVVDGCASYGVAGLYLGSCVWWNCAFTNNYTGYYSGYSSAHFYNCSFIGNTQYGCEPDGSSTFVNCLFFDHVTHINNCDNSRMVNCVFHKASGDSIVGNAGAGLNVIMNCRFSLCGASNYHVDPGNDQYLSIGNYFHDDGLGMTDDLTKFFEIGYNGTNTNESAGSDTDYGFVSISAGSEDFNLNSLASKRRQEFPVPGM